jgi:UDP-3-O-[3-hydroxymyristoyl] N-acetylglucosamine deacetylase / 3-hydroxyacyl-[acyl-carrier-protein] dehydratase
VKVHTVEHVISALAGMGVDNAIIEMDANEPPIGDGSALPYVECIKKAGIVRQDANPQRLGDPRAAPSGNQGRKPHHHRAGQKFRISVHPGRAGWAHSRSTFPLRSPRRPTRREIAPARTFVFYEDVSRCSKRD